MTDRETVIVDRGSRGSTGIILTIVIVLLAIGAFILFTNMNRGSGGTLDIDVPAVTVDVTPDGQ